MIRLIISTFFICLFLNIQAQQYHRCSSDEKSAELAKVDKEYAKILKAREDLSIFTNFQKRSVTGTIPVHVIIVHPTGQAVGSGDNLSLEHIQSQIDVLNDDFSRNNSDAGNTPSSFSAVSTGIQFCLATVDPDGNATDGVTRYPFNGNFNNNEESIKSATAWDNELYMNIWVADISNGLLGWAYFPGTGAPLDGVVILTGAFGGQGYAWASPYDAGRTATHEIGHYLGLNHTFVGGCGSDDGFSDTPIQQSPNYGCPNHPSPSCSNGGDMFMNYMDYVDDGCMNAFTAEQSAYMNNVLSSTRSGLIGNAGTACSEAAPMSAQIVNIQHPLCYEEASGSIEVEAIGGTPTYNYEINGAGTQSSPLFENLPAGFYEIIVYDSGGQSVSLTVDLFNPDMVVVNALYLQDPLCTGEATGIIEVDASGGNIGSFEYSIDNGPTSISNQFGNLTQGSYEVTAIDENGCSGTSTFDLYEPIELTISSFSSTDNLCFDDTDASISVSASGGTGSLMYSLNSASPVTTSAFENLATGSYTVQVIDANGCTVSINTQVNSPGQLNVDIENMTPIDCPEETSTITLAATGGTTGNYQYSIDGTNYQLETTFDNVAAGTYTLYTKDANDCIASQTTTISAPDPLTVNTIMQTNVECFGDFSGSVQLEVSSGNNVSYTMNNETNTTGFFDNLTSQVYNLVITDENDCISNSQIEIEQSSTLDVSFASIENILCSDENNGSLSLEATGGSGTYTYSVNGSPFTTQTEYDNLSSGMYGVIVQDESGCQAFSEVIISAPSVLSISTLDVEASSCFNTSDGAVSANAAGGSGGYMYSINGTENNIGSFSDLPTGEYTLMITDSNNCTTSTSVSITSPDPIDVEINAIVNSNCDGDPIGALMSSASGGTGNLTYSLNGQSNTTGTFTNLIAGSFMLNVSDENNCSKSTPVFILATTDIESNIETINTPSCNSTADGSITVASVGGNGMLTYGLNGQSNTSGTFNNLSAGEYTMVITDADGCFGTLEFDIDSPVELVISSIEAISPRCNLGNDASVDVSAAGGTGSISYTLNGITNNNGVFNNLEAGNYDLIITDQNGCSESSTISIAETEPISTVVSNIIPTSCFDGNDGSLQVSAQNGNSSYTYSINGESNSTGMFNNLSPGEVTINITDVEGCTTSTTTLIGQGPEITSQITSLSDVVCQGESNGSATILAVGNGTSYTYSIDGISNTTGTFENLSANTYQVQITNADGCMSSTTLTIQDGAQVNISDVSTNDVSCFDYTDGVLELQAQGDGPLTYTVNGQSNSTGIFNNLNPAQYSIIVTDQNGCTESETAQINNPEPMSLEVIKCASTGDCDINSFMIMVEGGVGPYSYSIDNGSSFQNEIEFTEVLDGEYSIQILDANGCSFDSIYAFTSIDIDEGDLTPQQEKLYPVPTTDLLTFEFILQGEQEMTFTTFDMTGKRIGEITGQFTRGLNTITMDVSNYANAMYILEVKMRSERKYHKFQKTNK